jgi:hypothetical protein
MDHRRSPGQTTLTTTKSARWAGIVLLILPGLLGLHIPHYFAETASPASYAAYPGLILVIMMVAVVIAAVARAQPSRRLASRDECRRAVRAALRRPGDGGPARTVPNLV